MKKRPVYKNQTVTVMPFDYPVTFVVADSVDDFIAWKFPTMEPTSQAAAHVYLGKHSWVVLPRGADINSIVHEVWHAARRAHIYVHAELENEVMAYTLGWLVETAVKFLWKCDSTYRNNSADMVKRNSLTKRKKGSSL
jgi:hypothetical protein